MSAATSSLLRGLDFMFNRDENADSHNHVVVKGSSFIRQFLLICGYDEDTWIQNSVTGTSSNRSRQPESFLRSISSSWSISSPRDLPRSLGSLIPVLPDWLFHGQFLKIWPLLSVLAMKKYIWLFFGYFFSLLLQNEISFTCRSFFVFCGRISCHCCSDTVALQPCIALKCVAVI